VADTKGKKVEEPDDDDDTGDDGDGESPLDKLREMMAEVVDERLTVWTKKNQPKRRTNPANEETPSWYESLFGKL
jgi:hypothetical protein